ncbi:MAG TPA: GNAT family N-acetyltransferase [Longimicrobiaceae bacterium]|nr:GNAT family N-acetyltransferase [Longimicrobiaceae bacterium]
MTVIETERLLLRELTDEDHDRLYELYLDPRVNRFLGGPPPPYGRYLREVNARWPLYYRKHGFGLWGVIRKADGETIGRCGLLKQEVDGVEEVEVGYALGADYWGRGYATEAGCATRDWGFRNLGVAHLISLIMPENAASIRSAGRTGMTVWKMTDFKGYHVQVHRITRDEWERLAAETRMSG